MRIYLYVIYILLLSVSCQSKVRDNINIKKFEGVWEYSKTKDGEAWADFRLDLAILSKDSVTGRYCSIMRGGRKIDCSTDKIDNIRGKLTKDTLNIIFHGLYDENSMGAANLYLSVNEDSLYWQLLNVEGEIFVPKFMILHKEINNPKTIPLESDIVDKGTENILTQLNSFVENNFCIEDIIDQKNDISCRMLSPTDRIIALVDSLGYDSSDMNVYFIEKTSCNIEVFVLEAFRGDSSYFILLTLKNDIEIISTEIIGSRGNSDLKFINFCIDDKLAIYRSEIQYVIKNDELIVSDTLKTSSLQIENDGYIIQLK